MDKRPRQTPERHIAEGESLLNEAAHLGEENIMDYSTARKKMLVAEATAHFLAAIARRLA